MIEIYGICGECNQEELLNNTGGICWQCWSNLDYAQHEIELSKTKTMTTEEE